MDNKDYIIVEDLTISYDIKPVLWDVDLQIPKGALMAIVGPNGAGKSTLIKGMLGLVNVVTGYVTFFGKSYEDSKKQIAYVPQRGSVDWDFPTTVFDVVLMGRYGDVGWFKRPTKEDKEIALNCLERVGMSKYKSRQISELSGGQQQRVFLARALAQKADIYIMDEPFQGVDVVTEEAIVNIFKLLKSEGKTLIIVHHDLKTVPKYFDHVALINLEVIAQGKIEDVFTDENINQTYQERSIKRKQENV